MLQAPMTCIRGPALGKPAEQCYCESGFLLILELLLLCAVACGSHKLCSCLPCQALAVCRGHGNRQSTEQSVCPLCGLLIPVHWTSAHLGQLNSLFLRFRVNAGLSRISCAVCCEQWMESRRVRGSWARVSPAWAAGKHGASWLEQCAAGMRCLEMPPGRFSV